MTDKKPVGELKVGPMLFLEWNIPNYEENRRSRWFYSPHFTIKDVNLQLYGQEDSWFKHWIYLDNLSKKSLELALITIYNIRSDGSERKIGSKKNLAFKKNPIRLDDLVRLGSLDTNIRFEDLEPEDLPNGELRLLFRFLLKDEDEDASIEIPVIKSTILDDLNQVGDITDMKFSDFELVRIT